MFIPLSSEPLTGAVDSLSQSAAASSAHITPPAAAGSNITTVSISTGALHRFFGRTSSEKLSADSIVGICIGAVLFLALAVTLSFFLYRHLRRRAAFKAEQLRIAREEAAQQAIIDDQIAKQKMREQVFRNAKIIQADAMARYEEGKWDRLKARKERERRMREAEALDAALKPAQTVHVGAEKNERVEKDLYRPQTTAQTQPHDATLPPSKTPLNCA